MTKPYFRSLPGDPAPLRITVARTVRFQENDPLGIVWHGRYPDYFEDARVALSDHYGIGYLDFYHAGVVTPIRQLHVDYFKPLTFNEPFTIEGILHWSEAARVNMEFILRNAAGEVTTSGYTVQMMMDRDHNLLLVPPPIYQAFLDRWRGGGLA